MKTWFLADAHFDHERLMAITARPFDNVAEWNAIMLNSINYCVERHHRLVLVGDFGFSARIAFWRQKIKCRHIVFILGNHDTPAKIRKAFSGEVYQQRTMKLFDTKVFVSHYPNAFWDGSHKGWPHVYGHCHHQREDYLDSIWPERRSMDVGPDTAYELYGEWRPHEDTEIYNRLMARKGHDDLEFYHDYQAKLAERRRKEQKDAQKRTSVRRS